MYRTKEQNTKLHALIGKLNIDAETKEELVYNHTGGREISSSKMLIDECAALINHLINLDKKENDSSENKQRRKILSICHEMKWHTTPGQLDWERINNWLIKYGYMHKGLNDYNYNQLPKLVTQFETLLKKYYASR